MHTYKSYSVLFVMKFPDRYDFITDGNFHTLGSNPHLQILQCSLCHEIVQIVMILSQTATFTR